MRPPEGYTEKHIESMPAGDLVSGDGVESISTGGYSIPVQSDLMKAQTVD